jgi:hypothetical protein
MALDYRTTPTETRPDCIFTPPLAGIEEPD